jgi:tRNA modification GTPase
MTRQLTGIFALATSRQKSALHLIRITGDDLQQVSCFFQNKNLFSQNLQPRTQYAQFISQNGSILDDVLVTTFKGPRSYTGLDVIEIVCHGNPVISQGIQSCLRASGLRDAKPGEFTLLAYLNGKCSLVEAERIQSLIEAPSLKATQLFSKEAQHNLQRHFEKINDDFLDLLVSLESVIEFSEDVGFEPFRDLQGRWKNLLNRIESLIQQFRWSKSLQLGLSLGLFGRPNVGKSSLFNYLLKRDEAIVTNQPGTTRDVLSAQVRGKRFNWTLYDTAGLHESQDAIENLGMNKALDLSSKLSVRFLVSDLWQKSLLALKKDFVEFEKKLGKIDVLLLSKADQDLSPDLLKDIRKELESVPVWPVSVFDDRFMNPFLSFLESFEKVDSSPLDESYGLSERQGDLLEKSFQVLQEAYWQIENEFPEVLALQIRQVQHYLEELLGGVNDEKVYENIFSKFCIGK